MRPVLESAYRALLDRFAIDGAVLEVGPPADMDGSLLQILVDRGHDGELVAIDRNPRTRAGTFRIECGDASDMRTFDDGAFGAVISHAVLEHDPAFWLTLQEMRRVLAPGGLLVLGVPGLRRQPRAVARLFDGLAARRPASPQTPSGQTAAIAAHPLVGWVRTVRRSRLLVSTTTYRHHEAPGVGDYWRFTDRAVREVLLGGLEVEHLEPVGDPVMWVGVGRAPRSS